MDFLILKLHLIKLLFKYRNKIATGNLNLACAIITYHTQIGLKCQDGKDWNDGERAPTALTRFNRATRLRQRNKYLNLR
jgi:hypothetical protein